MPRRHGEAIIEPALAPARDVDECAVEYRPAVLVHMQTPQQHGLNQSPGLRDAEDEVRLRCGRSRQRVVPQVGEEIADSRHPGGGNDRIACGVDELVDASGLEPANERNLDLAKVEEFDSPTGKGATGKVDGKIVVLGNASFLASLGIETRFLEEQGERLRGEGATVINIAVDGKLAGLFAIADPVKPSTPDALKALAAEGIKVIMLTGDNRTTANAVARKLGIVDVEAEVLPDQKIAVVTKLQKAGRIVAMAGDGVNDAPALAAAKVGIAMGTGTDVAMESAGITLLGGDLGGIVRARRLSQATMSNIRQNLFFAFIYNAAGIPIAAGILYPHFGILLSPIIAAAAMALSSVSVVGNALRLRVTRL